MSKAEKKRLCRVLDCQKLSPEVRAHAVKNERLPLRTVVQVLFFEQERSYKATSINDPPSLECKLTSAPTNEIGRLKLGCDSTKEKDHQNMKRSDGKLPFKVVDIKRDVKAEADHEEVDERDEKGKEIVEKGIISGSKFDSKKIIHWRNGSDHEGRDKSIDK